MAADAIGRERLAALERDVEAEYRELARQELQRRVQELVDSSGGFSPLKREGFGSTPDPAGAFGDDAGGDRS
jgi:hypothetical protein